MTDAPVWRIEKGSFPSYQISIAGAASFPRGRSLVQATSSLGGNRRPDRSLCRRSGDPAPSDRGSARTGLHSTAGSAGGRILHANSVAGTFHAFWSGDRHHRLSPGVAPKTVAAPAFAGHKSSAGILCAFVGRHAPSHSRA
ncbi:hypothetical protein SDC9_201438 [bioreactor metagenome]|uniref:Uncharacterized protein n=1 Tax=bioreactor metagenome TaxID=1076179 RepID=A0A645ISH2_9ZZZZ